MLRAIAQALFCAAVGVACRLRAAFYPPPLDAETRYLARTEPPPLPRRLPPGTRPDKRALRQLRSMDARAPGTYPPLPWMCDTDEADLLLDAARRCYQHGVPLELCHVENWVAGQWASTPEHKLAWDTTRHHANDWMCWLLDVAPDAFRGYSDGEFIDELRPAWRAQEVRE